MIFREGTDDEICNTVTCHFRPIKPKAVYRDLLTGRHVCLACAQKANAEALRAHRPKRCISDKEYLWECLSH